MAPLWNLTYFKKLIPIIGQFRPTANPVLGPLIVYCEKLFQFNTVTAQCMCLPLGPDSGRKLTYEKLVALLVWAYALLTRVGLVTGLC